MIEAKALRTFIGIYSLFRIERLIANIKLTDHIKNDFVCLVFELAAQTYRLKSQRLQNKVLHTIGNFPRSTPDRDSHTIFSLPYVYDYITKLCRQQAKVVQKHENIHIRSIEQGEGRRRKYKSLKLGGGQAYDRSSD
jgi:hypothetical protein